jgi:hypothetical protein
MTTRILAVILALLCLATADVEATEWLSAQLSGPDVKTVGRTAVTFRSSLYLFVSSGREVLYRQSSDAVSWSPRHWNRLDIATPSSPAAAVLNGNLHLFYRSADNEIQFRTFDGSTWSDASLTGARSTTAPAAVTHDNAIALAWRDHEGVVRHGTFNGSALSGATPIPGRTTNLAPAIASFEGTLHVVVTAVDGRFSLTKPPTAGWIDISCMGCPVAATDPVSMVVSNGRLLLFTTGGTSRRVLMRLLDTRLGDDRFLPEDDWMRVGTSGPSVAAGALGRRVALFFDKPWGVPGAVPIFVPAYGLSYLVAEWTTIPLAIVQAADDAPGCAAPADLTNVAQWILYANLVYAPLLIEYTRSHDQRICDVRLQALDSTLKPSFDKKVASDYASKPPLEDKVVVYIRARASGGAFSGADSNFVAMPETMDRVCDAGGTTSLKFYNNMLAHELGHYFGLPHTFRDFPKSSQPRPPESQAEIQTMLEDAKFDLAKAFDNDLGTGVDDTPADPLFEKANVSDAKCTSKDAPVVLTGSDGKPFPHTPPRTNVMSYYQISDTIVNSLTPGQRAVVYRFIRSKVDIQ